MKTLIDSELKKQERDDIKQSVIFAPENKVSCLKQDSEMNRLFFQTRKFGLGFCMRNFLQLLLCLQHSNLHCR